ncbi:serine protease [Suttonella sp. R2A3]|uniref:S1 family peptidase n=1 Tax=Suttonella sp. R2A3 TaxID=2908648 RepID=UPI001F1B78E6|nr:serine protease [Suttonella sp. R2A3]UJF24117.1 serine protease [Suttonella sp. R2A3]
MKHILLLLGLSVACAASAQPMLSSEQPSAQPSAPQSEVNRGSAALNASDLFAQYQPSIYQIRVINQATGQKTSIGSGFVVGDGSLLATNYHVVSDAVQKENHSLRYVDHEDNEGKLTLLGVDVVHDLAIVKAEDSLGKPFEFAPIPAQGAALYALGNPHDLGFIIIDGINNGLLKKSAQARILFSGSLNGGMSGGPTLNARGDVVGVNVAFLSQGNDISFVIPAEHVEALMAQVDTGKQDVNAAIAAQLAADNQRYFVPHLDEQWENTVIGAFRVPLSMSDDVRCWDSSPTPDVDDLLGMESVTCYNDRSTFISNDVTLGQFGYAYTHFYAREPLWPLRFYRLYSRYYSLNTQRRPQRDFDDISCEADFVRIADSLFKTTLCRQPSKQFIHEGEAVEDMRLIAAKIGDSQQGFSIEIALNGVQSSLGKQVMTHMLQQIQREQD